MYHPTRGGTRGGAAEFSWDAVRQDKDREHYLGHSTLAPTGRWQNHKDVNWYSKEQAGGAGEAAADARRQELLAIKQREEEEMNRRLGRKAAVQGDGHAHVGDALARGSAGTASTSARGSGANTAALGTSSRWGRGAADEGKDEPSVGELEAGLTKDERRMARKLARREVREQRRDERRRDRHERGDDRDRSSRHHHRRHHDDRDVHRSRSPERRTDDRERRSRRSDERSRDRRDEGKAHRSRSEREERHHSSRHERTEDGRRRS